MINRVFCWGQPAALLRRHGPFCIEKCWDDCRIWLPFISNASTALCSLLRTVGSTQKRGAGQCQYLSTALPHLPSTSSSVLLVPGDIGPKPHDHQGDVLTRSFLPSVIHLQHCTKHSVGKMMMLKLIQWDCHLLHACARLAGSDLGDGVSNTIGNRAQSNHVGCKL